MLLVRKYDSYQNCESVSERESESDGKCLGD